MYSLVLDHFFFKQARAKHLRVSPVILFPSTTCLVCFACFCEWVEQKTCLTCSLSLSMQQPSMWPFAVTARGRVAGLTWCTHAWATVSPALSRHATRCCWRPTSLTTSPRPPAVAPLAETRRWVGPLWLLKLWHDTSGVLRKPLYQICKHTGNGLHLSHIY